MNEKELISKAMSLLGKIKSKKKARSSRANGKLGGRPVEKKSSNSKGHAKPSR
jgi:hypothetical protein